MQLLFWTGIAIIISGIFGLGYCAIKALKIKKKNELEPFSEEAFAKLMGQLSIINMASLTSSMFGLMLLVLGLFL
jgi:hypothetical protein